MQLKILAEKFEDLTLKMVLNLCRAEECSKDTREKLGEPLTSGAYSPKQSTNKTKGSQSSQVDGKRHSERDGEMR